MQAKQELKLLRAKPKLKLRRRSCTFPTLMLHSSCSREKSESPGMFSQYGQEVKAWRDLEEVKAKGRKTRGRAVAEVEQTSTQVEESWRWKQNRASKAEEEVLQLQRDRHQNLKIQIHQKPNQITWGLEGWRGCDRSLSNNQIEC